MAGHVDLLCAAFELVDDRNADYSALDACSIIADNGWNAGIVLGEGRPFAGMPDLHDVRASLVIDDGPPHHAICSDAGGDPLEVVAWLERLLRRRGKKLNPGDWVMTGSIVATQFPQAGQSYRFAIDGLFPVTLSIARCG